jgi:hypothetical protein
MPRRGRWLAAEPPNWPGTKNGPSRYPSSSNAKPKANHRRIGTCRTIRRDVSASSWITAVSAAGGGDKRLRGTQWRTSVKECTAPYTTMPTGA